MPISMSGILYFDGESDAPFSHSCAGQTALVGRSVSVVQYEKQLGRDPKGRPLKLATSGSRDVPLMRSSIYHPEGEVDPRGAVAEYPQYKGRQGQTQMLTYWEEQTGKPSRQQRWYQWMKNQDAGPVVGALGAGWDGVDRNHMFPGEGAVLDPEDPRQGSLAPVPRFPEDRAAQEWIYRDAPSEITRPYQVDLVEDAQPLVLVAPEVAAVERAMALGGADRIRSEQQREQSYDGQEAARDAGQHSSYAYAGNGGTTYGDKARWEDPIGETPVLELSKTVHSVVQ
jgi:hypothetical protein